TIAALAKVLAGQGTAVLVGEEIGRADRDLPLPLSFAQQRLWFIDQLEHGAAAYHMPDALRLTGELNYTALQAALDRIIDRHETLRTVFANMGGGATQIILPRAPFALSFIDLQHLSAEEHAAQIRLHSGEEVGTAFDLSVGPLIRGRLLTLSTQEHVLLITMHHIVSDGWSMGIFLQELAALYAAYCEGRVDPLPPPSIQYADYAVWQRQRLQGDLLQRQLDYWKTQLAGAPSLLELPTDRPRPQTQSYRGGRFVFALSAELSLQLKKLARQHDATLFMTIYTGFSILLSRLCGQDNIVIGTPVANRPRTDIEELIGFFVNTLALRADLGENPSVVDLLADVKAMTLAAYAHQDLPFEQVVEAVQPPRSLRHSSLFQAMLVLQNTPQGAFSLPGLRVVPQEISYDVEPFDVTLSLMEAGEHLVGSFSYASDLFDQATIERWAAYLKTVLAAMVDDPAQKVKSINLLGSDERHQLLAEFNASAVDYPQGQLLHELFEAQVQKTPDAIAVVYGEQKCTYAELNRQANQLAHYLRSQGVVADQLVAICVERSVTMIVGLLGILKAGGAYVPLDPAYPPERLAYMLEDSAPAILLTQQSLQALLSFTKARVIVLDTMVEELDSQGMHNPDAKRDGLMYSHLAYMMYTSGSTGQPKGAMNEHRAVVNRLHWMQDQYTLDETDKVLQKTPFGFDVSVWEFFWPLLNGASLVFARPQGHQDPAYLNQLIAAEKITTVHFVPSMLQAFLANGPARYCDSLRTIVCSGEELPVELQTWCLESLPQARLHNLYGPTEAAIDVTYWECRSDMGASRVPIGKPIANTQIYLLDAQLEPVPRGVSGEIYIGGAGVGRGYYHRPGLTAQRFIADHFSNKPGARLYKTGDLGRYKADGNIEYLGRNDHQVKIRGFRIELGEIEAQLCKHAAIKEAVVIAREDIPGEKRLVAYLTSHADQAPGIHDLRIHLQASLPGYMVPGAFVFLTALPLSANGKLDRKLLPAPEHDAYASRAYEAPQGEIEEALALIWQQLLRLERVGRHDNFFELGGHSLLAVHLVSQIRMVLGRDLPLREVFLAPSIAELGRRIAIPAVRLEENDYEEGII
ncbi:amino acid adenylation domain-containing protein, partial [Undibacterium sp. TJN19]|uniref:amino acid adenylation domain-containing protein n=1 Tax=Undibacterium sp. TJN19 TaxID=3413055 RepID=UPI003BF1616F